MRLYIMVAKGWHGIETWNLGLLADDSEAIEKANMALRESGIMDCTQNRTIYMVGDAGLIDIDSGRIVVPGDNDLLRS